MDAEQIWRQAQDENTSPEILAKLAKSKDKEILRLVAGNPNTPVKILEKLGEEFPDAIVANPIFNLLLIENPENKFLLLSLARASTTSVDKLKELASCREEIIVKAVVKNSKTPASILDNAYKSLGHRLPIKAFLENRNTGDATLARIVMRFSGKTESDYRSILEHPNASEITINMIKLKDKRKNIPARFLEEFASNEDRNIRCQVSRYPNVSAKVLEKLSLDNDTWIRKNVAAHPNTSIKTIEKLARDEHFEVRYAVATSNNISPKLAQLLLQDENHYVRKEIARNIKTPIEIIDKLVEDDEPEVRGAVAARKDISEENAYILAHDVSVEVIEELANNKNAPTKIHRVLKQFCTSTKYYESLRFHEYGSISKYFQELSAINIPEEIANKIAEKEISHIQNLLIREEHESIHRRNFLALKGIINSKKNTGRIAIRRNNRIRRLLATNKNISDNVFHRLIENENFYICLGFIDNPNTPSEILSKLSENENKLIREGVAKHVNTSIKTLDILKDDRNISVREKVAQNPKISPEIIEELASDSVPLVRRAIAENLQTPAAILNKLKSDRSLSVRRAVAENPNTLINTLEELLNDEAPKIRESAKHSLMKRSL